MTAPTNWYRNDAGASHVTHAARCFAGGGNWYGVRSWRTGCHPVYVYRLHEKR